MDKYLIAFLLIIQLNSQILRNSTKCVRDSSVHELQSSEVKHIARPDRIE
jgi:hypothetical protein